MAACPDGDLQAAKPWWCSRRGRLRRGSVTGVADLRGLTERRLWERFEAIPREHDADVMAKAA